MTEQTIHTNIMNANVCLFSGHLAGLYRTVRTVYIFKYKSKYSCHKLMEANIR